MLIEFAWYNVEVWCVEFGDVSLKEVNIICLWQL